MGDMNENLVKAVKHYQDSLDRHTENRNDNKLLHYLDRLYKLPIKVVHLEQTGVGRTVNGLRKLGGEVGEYARRLVTKWKEMVVGEQEEEEDEDEEDGYQTGEDQSSDDDTQSPEIEQVRENSSSHRKSDKTHNETDDRNKVRKSGEHSSKSGHTSHSSESKSSSEKDRHKENGHDRHKSHKRKAESSEDETPKKKKKSEGDSRHRRRIDSDSEDDKKRDRKHKKYDKPEKKKPRDSSDDDSEHETKTKEKRHKHEKKKVRELSDEDSDDEYRSREKKKSHKSLDKDKEKPSTSKDTHKDKHKHSKKEDYKRHEHSSKTKENDKKSKHRSEEKERTKDKGDDKKEKKKKVANGGLKITGIDSGSGTSFAEALGMCEPSSSKSSAKKKPTEKKDKPPSKSDDSVPKLLLKEPVVEPLDLNLSSLLPSITPNYRPLGNLLSSDAQPKKFLSESETLSNIISSKNQRTKVYSGNKVGYGKVPSLFELCTRILQDNIDALEYTGGVPYIILKPILEKATPNQLYMMEHHNPYLIEDTDELWQLHCQKEFRNKPRQELETWREMYLRCLDERDAKLKALTANIKQSQDKSLPVRMTKLAYVDAVAKPPRNIARKQAKNGTAFDIRKPAVTPSSRLNSLATAGEAGKVAVPNPGSRAVERTSSHATKPKKAPLMLKSISSFKNRFKR